MRGMIKKTWQIFWRWGWLLALTLWIIGFGLFYVNTPKYPLPADAAEQTPVIVVLTGGQGRLEQGIAHLKANPNAVMFISGVGSGVQVAELADVMDVEAASPLLEEDYPRIVLGRMATDTAENASETVAWLQNGGHTSIILVTSYYHTLRSHMEFHHVMPDLTIIPSPVMVDEARGLNGLRLMFLEYHKFMLRWLYNHVQPIQTEWRTWNS